MKAEDANAAASNLKVYTDAKTVSSYRSSQPLMPCEEMLFARYIDAKDALLDLGVGGGRTTAALAHRVARYCGIDLSPAMIAAAREQFPELDLRMMNAADLSPFGSEEFNAVVFSFNGLDYLVPEKERNACIAECFRVLKSGGFFIFSTHHPRAVLQLPKWVPLRAKADEIVSRLTLKSRFVKNILAAGGLALLATAITMQNFVVAVQRVFSSTFWRGRGYVLDPVHGGLVTYTATPTEVIASLEREGFHLVELARGDGLRKAALPAAWYYYVFTKGADEG